MLTILGYGAALPARIVTNDELATMVDTSDEWIVSKTGIKTRRVCVDETLTDLAYSAACEALQRSSTDPGDLGLIVCSTICGDFTSPSLACCVAERLGVSVPAFDVNAACAGFLYAINAAAAQIALQTKIKSNFDGSAHGDSKKRILIISAEMLSKHTDWTDRNTCVLFGDGAGAVVAEPGGGLRYIKTYCFPNREVLYKADATSSPFASYDIPRGYLRMDGQRVFKFAVSKVGEMLDGMMNSMSLTPNDIDYFVLHQANKRIIDSARLRLNLPEDKFPTNIERYGNMSSACVPILLSEMWEKGMLKKGVRLFMSAFGAGLTAACCYYVCD
ncbi:MAG: ketoacyl-ACP synthase III [Clostridiales bacterium]|nr:ketoacyl-ACP synthase III [Clostridiales bacterium]